MTRSNICGEKVFGTVIEIGKWVPILRKEGGAYREIRVLLNAADDAGNRIEITVSANDLLPA